MLHYLPLVIYVNLQCFHFYYTDRPKHFGGIVRWMDSSSYRVHSQFLFYDHYHCLILFHCQPTSNLKLLQVLWLLSMLLKVQKAEPTFSKTKVKRTNYCDFLSGIIMSRLVLLLLQSNMPQFKWTTEAYRTANNFHTFLSPGVNKSCMPGHLGN